MNDTTLFMIKCFAILIAICIVHLVIKKQTSRKIQLIAACFVIWCGIFVSFLVTVIPPLNEQVHITALGDKNNFAEWNQIILDGYTVNDEKNYFSDFREGSWLQQCKDDTTNNYMLVWVPKEDQLWVENITDSITVNIPVGVSRELVFIANQYSGYVQIEHAGIMQIIDTYSATPYELKIALTASSKDLLLENNLRNTICYVLIYGMIIGCIVVGSRILLRPKQLDKIKKYSFLFNELVKRDFTLKYKRTVLGAVWSIISPLINLLIMWLVFNQLLGSGMEHYVIYLFAGQMIFGYFNEATNQGMTSLLANAAIFTKVNVPKYMFLFSKNISSLINFGLTLIVFFVFVFLDGIEFKISFIMLVFPIAFLILFNIGMGLILSALFVFFRDMQYLWGLATQLIMWLSAIFYPVTNFPYEMQNLFFLNPLYAYISYFRTIIIDGAIPSIELHILIVLYSMLAFIIGCIFYKKYNHEFLYYV